MTFFKTLALVRQEYLRLRGLKLTRYQAWDLATFYVPLPWRSVGAFAAGCLIALVITFAAGRATAAELRVDTVSKRDGKARSRKEQLATWNECVRGAYVIRARVVTARRLAIYCNGRRV